MVHSITKQNHLGHIELNVNRSKVNEKLVFISLLQFNHENELKNDTHIELDESEFYDYIGTLLFVQSQLKK